MFPASRAVCIASYASETYCCPDCWRGFFSVNTAALLLVASMIRRYLTFRTNLNACPTAASSAEYGFCSVLGPNVILKVSSLGPPRMDSGIRTTPPIPTMLFRPELLTAIRTAHPVSICAVAVSSTVVSTRSSHGANTNGSTVSRLSNGTSLRRSDTW